MTGPIADVAKSSQFDPNVWSGRALQEGFVELAMSGLASMYSAFDWSSKCSWPSWISARVRAHYRTGLSGPFGSPVFTRAGKTRPPSRLILSQTSAGKICRLHRCVFLISRRTIRRVGRWRSTSPRSPGHEPERSMRCAPACWPARSPAHCGAAASWQPRSRV